MEEIPSKESMDAEVSKSVSVDLSVVDDNAAFEQSVSVSNNDDVPSSSEIEGAVAPKNDAVLAKS
eukprot:scaffold10603_cov268-Ochromonas_danica.AAC.1